MEEEENEGRGLLYRTIAAAILLVAHGEHRVGQLIQRVGVHRRDRPDQGVETDRIVDGDGGSGVAHASTVG